MSAARPLPTEMKVLMNHIYEYRKGVRRMVLFTCNRKYEDFATSHLQRLGIPYMLQPAGKRNLNLYFGRSECLDAIKLIITRPLNELSPEEDFILGAMLGYDICAQCERFCLRKGNARRTQAETAYGQHKHMRNHLERGWKSVKLLPLSTHISRQHTCRLMSFMPSPTHRNSHK